MEKKLDVVELTQKLLSFNTINPPGEERACAHFLGDLLKENGFEVTYHEFDEKRTSVIAEVSGKSDLSPICFTGHIDVVPLGATPWTKDPFKGEIEGDKLFGRGVADMKGGVAAFVVAAIETKRDLPDDANIVLVITAGEEIACEGAAHLVKDGMLDKAGAIVVAEPSGNYPYIGNKGILWIEAKTTGVTAHGSLPEEGENAVLKAIDAVKRLTEYEFPISEHKHFGKPTMNIGRFNGGLNVNSVPDSATFSIDIRTIPGMKNEDVLQDVIEILGDEFTCTVLQNKNIVYSEPEQGWIQGVFDIMEGVLGERPTPKAVTYATDSTQLTPAYGNPPTINMGPGELDQAHKTDEFCYISKLKDATAVYKKLAVEWSQN